MFRCDSYAFCHSAFAGVFEFKKRNDHDGYAKEIALLRSRFTKADGKK